MFAGVSLGGPRSLTSAQRAKLVVSAAFQWCAMAPIRQNMRLTLRFWRGLSSMSMQAESLEILEKASVAPAQARAIVRAIEIEIAGARDTLATRHDVLALAQQIGGLRGEIAQVATSLRSEMAQLATSLRSEMAQLATSLRSEVAELETRLRSEMAQLATRDELAKLGGELHAEIHRAVSGATRQMYMALLGHMAMTLGFIYFLITQLR
jgi:hypothetical protein